MRETPVDDSSSLSQQGHAYAVSVGSVFVGNESVAERTQNTTMAKAESETSAKLMSKDVQIVAYLKVDSDLSAREVMQSLDTSKDYEETTTNVRHSYRAVFAGSEKRLDEEEYEYLKDKDPAGIRLIHYTDETESYDNGDYSFTASFRRDVTRDVTLAMPQSDMETRWGKKVQIDNETVFKVNCTGPALMRKLKHQSEIDSDDKFEDDDTEYWTLTLRCQVDGLKPSLYRWFDDTVVPELMGNAAKHDWVSQVRVMDCEKEYSESGVCFDI